LGLAALFASLAVGSALATGVEVSIQREETRVRVLFTGTLESAESIEGPWSSVPGAASPYEIPAAEITRFFRARDADGESVFASASAAGLTVEGPLQQHFELALAGLPDGIFPPRREKPWFEGTLHYAGLELPVELRVRGNSSLQECPFPKLKFKLDREHRVGTPFADAREIKIGTHCAEGGEGPVGRLRDQRAAFREALAYEAMATLRFTTPRIRRAVITYFDTSEGSEGRETGWQVTRHAFLLEDIEVLAERLGGRALSDEEIGKLTDARLDKVLITELHLLHALLGNWDYQLSVDGRWLWNTEVIAFPDGSYLPVPGDFDLASWVTGVVRRAAPHDYHPEMPDVEREARYRVEQLATSVGAEVFAEAAHRFSTSWHALDQLVAGAAIDAAGRTNAGRHLAAFAAAIGE
jgi:hypothetical protein